MTAEKLREAARLMRARAEPLIEMRNACAEIGSGHYERQIERHGGGPTFRDHFSSWHPAVALAVADWLEHYAAVLAAQNPIAFADDAIAVALAYLNEATS